MGIQASALLSLGIKVGDEVYVVVLESHPREDIILLKEVGVAQ